MTHPPDCGCPAYGCVLRAKGVQVAPSATPSRVSAVPPRRPDPAWERGIVGERRPGGSFMPYLAPDTRSHLHVKEYGEKRHAIDEQVRRLKTAPQPLRSA